MRLLGIIVGLLFASMAFGQSMGQPAHYQGGATKYETATGEQCDLPTGCDWRTVITIRVVDSLGNENWNVEWTGPRLDFLTNVEHNYLLLEHIYTTPAGEQTPMVFKNARGLIKPEQFRR